jgi:hypothetical protein
MPGTALVGTAAVAGLGFKIKSNLVPSFRSTTRVRSVMWYIEIVQSPKVSPTFSHRPSVSPGPTMRKLAPVSESVMPLHSGVGEGAPTITGTVTAKIKLRLKRGNLISSTIARASPLSNSASRVTTGMVGSTVRFSFGRLLTNVILTQESFLTMKAKYLFVPWIFYTLSAAVLREAIAMAGSGIISATHRSLSMYGAGLLTLSLSLVVAAPISLLIYWWLANSFIVPTATALDRVVCL